MDEPACGVFFAYSLQDWRLVEAIAAAWQRAGVSSWHQAGEDFGAPWREVIYNALSGCAIVVVVATANSQEALWVAREVAWATRERKPVIVLEYDDVRWMGSAVARVRCNRAQIPDPLKVVPAGLRDQIVGPSGGTRRAYSVHEVTVELALAFRSAQPITALDWAADNILLGHRDGSLRLLDEDGRQLRHATPHTDWVWRVVSAPNGQSVASVSNDGRLVVGPSNLSRNELVHVAPDWLWGISWERDSMSLYYCGYSGGVQYSQLDRDEKLRATEIVEQVDDWLWCCALSADGRWLAYAGADGIVRVRDCHAGVVRRALYGHSGGVFDVDWNPESGRLVSAGHDSTLRVWEPSENFARQVLTGHLGWALAARWSPDGSMIASVSSDRTLRIWSAGIDSFELSTIPLSGRPTALSWHRSGSRLAVSHGRTVCIYSVHRKS